MTQRRAAAAADELAASGLPPAGSFEAVAREWVATNHKAKVSDAHAARTLIRFEQDVFPWVGRAYNRTTFAERRRVLMQAWADYLDTLRKGGDVLPFKVA